MNFIFQKNGSSDKQIGKALIKRVLTIVVCLIQLKVVNAQLSKHVILISIDGFRPEMYQDVNWPTPNLQWLMKRGVYAKHLKSVFPAYTYPSHAAMITGALPARSGIYFNQPKNSKGEWNWFLDSIKVPTLWQVLKQNSMTTASVEWPPSVGKGIDYDVPEIWIISNPYDRISEARKYATPGLIDEIERNATGTLDSNNFRDECFCLDENAGRIAAYLFKTYEPNFLALHFAEVDGMEHEYGTNADSVKLAVAADDRAIGEVLQAVRNAKLEDSTAIIIVGDHGFADMHEVFRPNMLIRDLPAKFIASGGSCFLYMNVQTPTQNAGSIITQVKKRLDQLPKEKRNLFRIVDRHELDKMGADSAAILALAADPKKGLVFSGAIAKSAIANNGPGTLIQQNPLEGIFIPIHGGHHGYDPNEKEMYTGFIAYGAGIKKGNTIHELSEPDIAVLIAKLLGVQFKCPDGKLVDGIVE